MELSSQLASTILNSGHRAADVENQTGENTKKPIRALIFSCCILLLVTIVILVDMFFSFLMKMSTNEYFITHLESFVRLYVNQTLQGRQEFQ